MTEKVASGVVRHLKAGMTFVAITKTLAIVVRFRHTSSLMADRFAFNEHMRSLTNSDTETTPLPEGEEWEQMIERIHETGKIHSIKEETYWYFLEVLPPKWMDRRYFAFAEGQEELSIFWQKQQAFCRRLTQDETDHFCETSGLSKSYGM